MRRFFRKIGQLLLFAYDRVEKVKAGAPSAIIFVVTGLAWLIVATRPQLEPLDLQEKSWSVEATRVRHETVQPDMSLYGEVLAGRESDMRALVSGIVIEVGDDFKEGGRVERDDLLVQIDPFEYEKSLAVQKALLEEAIARLEFLALDNARARKLERQGGVSAATLDESTAGLKQQKAVVSRLEVGVRRAQRDLENSRLAAPFSGLLSGVEVQAGKRLSIGDRVASLIDQRRLEVRFSLSKSQYGRIRQDNSNVIGRPVEVKWQIGDKTLSYYARIDRLGAQINTAVGGIDVFAVLTEPKEDTELRTGALVQIRLPDRRYDNVISISEQALYGDDTVYTVRDDRAVKRKVIVVGYDGTNVLLRGSIDEPIRDGAVILTTQLREVSDGAKVTLAKLYDSQNAVYHANNKLSSEGSVQ